jgi:membrane protein YqaA with SNARE-associated domain
MDILTNVILVFITSIVELWIGIPLGLFLDLNPLIVAITAAAGSILSAFIVIVLGDNLRKWFIKWRYGEKSIQNGRIYDIWNKYGIIGLGLLSPLLFGSPLGAALGIGLGAQKDRLFIWMSLGIIIWSGFLTVAGYFGLISFQSILH